VTHSTYYEGAGTIVREVHAGGASPRS
jgi:hypothetical protein